MNFLGFNGFDLVVIGIVVLSGLFALMRGLVKEVFSIISWVGAAAVALYGYAYVNPFVEGLVSPAWLASVVTGAGLFLISLIVLGMLATLIAGAVRKTSAGALDRSLGFLFGLARGVLIVCAAWLLVSRVMTQSERPVWLNDARTLPLVERGANALSGFVPGRAVASRPNRTENTKAPDGRPGTGYNDTERRDMNRLIQAIE
jgi:membrane protein required for colicin V production